MRPFSRRRFAAAEEVAGRDLERQLFGDLAFERPPRIFALLHLAARKFPVAGVGHVGRPAGHQAASRGIEDGGAHHVENAFACGIPGGKLGASSMA